ncbi:MAG: LysR family transcriptional regulator [Archangiaceae bacterium]|nr:LysR family transcriptional regulator [Archangiaceae bacterium]
MPVLEAFYDVRLADLMTFLAVRRQGTVTAAARELSVTPSQVSKAISRLEKALRWRLLARGSRGVTLTPSALRATPLFEAALESLRRARRGADQPLEITVAAPSYLLSAMLPRMAKALAPVRCRALQLAQGALAASMSLDQFEVALLTAPVPMTGNWSADHVGRLHSRLYTTPQVARGLKRPAPVSQLQSVPFVTPMSFSAGQWTPVQDGCPLPPSERRAGHEAQTIALALELAAETGQLIFGPALAAQPFIEQKRLVEVPVQDWDVSYDLILAVDVDRVTQKVHQTLRETAAAVVQSEQ